MSNLGLNIPKDPQSEIFYDPKKLVVGFRKRSPKEAEKTLGASLVLRIVVQVFGQVVEDRFFPKNSTVRIGPGRRNTLRFPTQGLPNRHPLIAYDSQGRISLLVNEHVGGVLQIQDRLQPLSEIPGNDTKNGKEIVLPPKTKGCLENGTLQIYFEEISDPEKAPAPTIFKAISDPQMMRWLVISLFIHLLLLLLIKFLPSSPREITLDKLPKQFQRIIVQPQDYKPFKPKITVATTGPQGKEGEGAKAPGPEGRRGASVPGRKLSRDDIARKGVLSYFSKGSSGNLQDLLGGGSVTGLLDNVGTGRPGLPGETGRGFGKGLKGTGTGGGGLSTSIGQGLGTKGPGLGAKGTGLADYGTGKSDVRVSATMPEEEVYIMGNIPKEVIAKIINDHMGYIRYCYERELNQNPKLSGKITMYFIIGLEGRVTSVTTKKTTMQSPAVESCIQGVIRRMPFPKPGAGPVEVSYPFLFRVAG